MQTREVEGEETYTSDSSFGNTVVHDESRLDLGSREAVTRDVDNVIDTSPDPVWNHRTKSGIDPEARDP